MPHPSPSGSNTLLGNIAAADHGVWRGYAMLSMHRGLHYVYGIVERDWTQFVRQRAEACVIGSVDRLYPVFRCCAICLTFASHEERHHRPAARGGEGRSVSLGRRHALCGHSEIEQPNVVRLRRPYNAAWRLLIHIGRNPTSANNLRTDGDSSVAPLLRICFLALANAPTRADLGFRHLLA